MHQLGFTGLTGFSASTLRRLLFSLRTFRSKSVPVCCVFFLFVLFAAVPSTSHIRTSTTSKTQVLHHQSPQHSIPPLQLRLQPLSFTCSIYLSVTLSCQRNKTLTQCSMPCCLLHTPPVVLQPARAHCYAADAGLCLLKTHCAQITLASTQPVPAKLTLALHHTYITQRLIHFRQNRFSHRFHPSLINNYASTNTLTVI